MAGEFWSSGRAIRRAMSSCAIPAAVRGFGEAHLRAVLAGYQEHYNTARPHQGIGQRIPDSARHPARVIAGDFRVRQIRRKPVLSGLINEYERAA